MCDRVIFIIVLSFLLPLKMRVSSASFKKTIYPYSSYISFVIVGSCNFTAPENLKCVRQQGLYINVKV